MFCSINKTLLGEQLLMYNWAGRSTASRAKARACLNINAVSIMPISSGANRVWHAVPCQASYSKNQALQALSVCDARSCF
jgi:hypothetical protein